MNDDDSATTSPSAARVHRLPQVSLRSALLVIVVCGVCLGYVQRELRRFARERKAEQEINNRLDEFGVRRTGAKFVGPAWLRYLYWRDEIFVRTSSVTLVSVDIDIRDQELLETIRRHPHIDNVFYTNVMNLNDPTLWSAAEKITQSEIAYLAEQLPDIEVSGQTYDP
ncbi:MAG: hypothetical protein QGG36_04395 [Pirellulaceae bacterium]|jgi:hypothetical protein|nr:hypothetical protein [Pirellulaceae bacterium]MDP7015010.1 hypothetical protein [Pirellulaceae bacterium]